MAASTVTRPWWQNAWRFVVRQNLHRLSLVIVVLFASSAALLTVLEQQGGFWTWLWYSVVTSTTVGYGDVTPVSATGRLVGTVNMFFGIGLLGIFTATMASLLVTQSLRKERGMGSYDFKDHLILCEWNLRAAAILRELRADPRCRDAPVVLIASLEAKPIDDEDLYFIKGNVDEENLRRARIETAKTVIVLGNDELSAQQRDAQVVLTALTIESLNPQAYSIAELVKGENVPHCRRAKVDEVIVAAEFSSHLIASSALDHGVSRVVSELLSDPLGNDLKKIAVPPELGGKTFIEVVSELKRKEGMIAVAVQHGDSSEVLTNPDANHRVETTDRLIVITAPKTKP